MSQGFLFDENRSIIGFDPSYSISEEEEKTLLLYLWRMENNRKFILNYYGEIEAKINRVHQNIEVEIEQRWN